MEREPSSFEATVMRYRHGLQVVLSRELRKGRVVSMLHKKCVCCFELVSLHCPRMKLYKPNHLV